MKHNEANEMKQYLRDHLLVSHGFSRAEVNAMRLALLAERHFEVHGHE